MANGSIKQLPSRPTAGFAYIALLVSLTVIMLTLGMAAENIEQSAKREREAQLLFVGKQFRNAIASYYEKSPQSGKQFPKTLDELLLDNRFPKPARHLRRLYGDPITNATAWGLVRSAQGEITGVFSQSQESPIRKKFDSELEESFGSGKIQSYSDWKFVYSPSNNNSDPAASAEPMSADGVKKSDAGSAEVF